MVEEVAEHPATLQVFNDFSGVFELVDIETVVHDIIQGIERRSAHVVSPRKLQLVTLLPGLVQKFIEWTSFSRDTVQEAAEIFRSDH